MIDRSRNFGRQLAVLARLWRTELDRRLKPLGLSQARFIVLVHVSEQPAEVTQLEIADRARIRGPTLVRQLDQLESEGLVERRDAPHDRRAKTVHLTSAGERRLAEALVVANVLRGEMLEGSDPHEIERTTRLLAELTQRIEEIARRAAAEADSDNGTDNENTDDV
jgi:MarR family transcriptional regulator, transcriptional regulator for hemolysin